MRASKYIPPSKYDEIIKKHPIEDTFWWWLLSLISFKEIESKHSYDDTFSDYMRAFGGIVMFISAPLLAIAGAVLFVILWGDSSPLITLSQQILLGVGGFLSGMCVSLLLGVVTAFIVAPILSPIGLNVYRSALLYHGSNHHIQHMRERYSKSFRSLARRKSKKFKSQAQEIFTVTELDKYPYDIGVWRSNGSSDTYVTAEITFRVSLYSIVVDNKRNPSYTSYLSGVENYLDAAALAEAISALVTTEAKKQVTEKGYKVTSSVCYFEDRVDLTVTFRAKNRNYVALTSWEAEDTEAEGVSKGVYNA